MKNEIKRLSGSKNDSMINEKYDALHEDEEFDGPWRSKRPLIVDGDVIAHLAAFSGTNNFDVGDGAPVFNEATACVYASRLIKNLQNHCNCTHVLIAFSDSKLDREDICPSYKRDRQRPQHDPLISSVKKYLDSVFTCITWKGEEADDVCMRLSRVYWHQGVIATIDKDLDQIPGEHINPKTFECHYVEPYDAELMFWKQCLTGDAVDGYYGVPGIGNVTAEDILDTASKVWCTTLRPNGNNGLTMEEVYWYFIVDAYEDCGLTEQDAVVTAICACIGGDFAKPRLITEQDLY